MSSQSIDRAQAEADAAREQLLASVHALQTRLRPVTLAENVLETALARSGTITAGAIRMAGRRPLAASAALVGLAALVSRKPIARLIARLCRAK